MLSFSYSYGGLSFFRREALWRSCCLRCKLLEHGVLACRRQLSSSSSTSLQRHPYSRNTHRREGSPHPKKSQYCEISLFWRTSQKLNARKLITYTLIIWYLAKTRPCNTKCAVRYIQGTLKISDDVRKRVPWCVAVTIDMTQNTSIGLFAQKAKNGTHPSRLNHLHFVSLRVTAYHAAPDRGRKGNGTNGPAA